MRTSIEQRLANQNQPRPVPVLLAKMIISAILLGLIMTILAVYSLGFELHKSLEDLSDDLKWRRLVWRGQLLLMLLVIVIPALLGTARWGLLSGVVIFVTISLSILLLEACWDQVLLRKYNLKATDQPTRTVSQSCIHINPTTVAFRILFVIGIALSIPIGFITYGRIGGCLGPLVFCFLFGAILLLPDIRRRNAVNVPTHQMDYDLKQLTSDDLNKLLQGRIFTVLSVTKNQEGTWTVGFHLQFGQWNETQFLTLNFPDGFANPERVQRVQFPKGRLDPVTGKPLWGRPFFYNEVGS